MMTNNGHEASFAKRAAGFSDEPVPLRMLTEASPHQAHDLRFSRDIFQKMNSAREHQPARLNAGKKILVVDDNLVVLKTISIFLKPRGYVVLTAATGSEALTLVRKEMPDLILLDLSFPSDASNISGPMVDGFLIIQWLRRMREAMDVPINIISVTEPEKYQDRARAAGVVACFHKPIDSNKLLEAIHEALDQTAVAMPSEGTVGFDFEV